MPFHMLKVLNKQFGGSHIIRRLTNKLFNLQPFFYTCIISHFLYQFNILQNRFTQKRFINSSLQTNEKPLNNNIIIMNNFQDLFKRGYRLPILSSDGSLLGLRNIASKFSSGIWCFSIRTW